MGNNVNPLFAPLIGFMAGEKKEAIFRSDDQILDEMKKHNTDTLRNIRGEGKTIFSIKHYVTLDTEEQNNF